MEQGDIKLRAVEPEDLELLYKWENNAEFWTVSNTIAPFSRYTLRQYIENSHKTIFETGQMRLMIVLKSTGETIGAADLFDFDPYHHRTGVGILIADAGNRRKGYATMAMKALASYCFEVLHLHQLYCNIPASNKPSVDLFLSLGFTISGTRKEWLRDGDNWADEYFLQLIRPVKG
ncbi:MAG: GNAT family N-acetyltransferase [Bacteroidetes bacterium]|nr:GNAT family N-acetyltransferase [Bacteroidota bacterium]